MDAPAPYFQWGFIQVPIIPRLRDIPRWVPIHRLIWRRFDAEQTARRP